MDEAPTTDELVVVVVGNFNPAIFHPAWLAEQGLVPRAAADNAEVALVHPAVAQFRCNDLTVYVDAGRLQVGTTTPAASLPTRDLAIGILTVLEHTPVTACGINRQLHLPAATGWPALARRLVTHEPLADLVSEPTTTSLQVRGQRPGSDEGALTVTLQPSTVVPGGVHFGYNEHHAQQAGVTTATFVRSVLERHWEPAQAHFQDAARRLLAGQERTV